MNEQDLKNIWQSSGNQDRVQFDKTKLIADLELNLNQLKKSIRHRDWREIGVAIMMIPLFGFTAYKIPFMLSKVGAIIIVGWCMLLIVRLVMAKKNKVIMPTESYINYLLKSRAYLQAQKELLDTVLYWYILPSVTGVLLFFMGFGLSTAQRIIFSGVTLGLGIFTYLLNKHAVRKGILPRLHRIDDIIKNLKE
jgi:hypothetical protein